MLLKLKDKNKKIKNSSNYKKNIVNVVNKTLNLKS